MNMFNWTVQSNTTFPLDVDLFIQKMRISHQIFLAVTIIAAVVLVENFIVLVLYVKKSPVVIKERRGFVLSLTFADSLVGLFHGMTYVLPLVDTSITESQTYTTMILALNYMAKTASVWSLFALVLDRFFSIRFPFRHRWLVPRGRIFPICFVVWVFSIAITLLQIHLKDHTRKRALFFVVTHLPPSFTTIILYLWIHIAAVRLKMVNRRRNSSAVSLSTNTSIRSNLVDARKSILFFSVVCFLQSSGILTETIIAIYYGVSCSLVCAPSGYGVSYNLWVWRMIPFPVVVSSSAINPWIHTFRHAAIWNAIFRQHLKHCCHKPKNSVPNFNSSPRTSVFATSVVTSL